MGQEVSGLVRRRTQAERRATTESRLLDAAIQIVAQQGVRAVTMAAAGERAGYSRGIVSHQFGSRDALMVRVAEAVQARFRPRAAGLRGGSRVLGVVDDYLMMVQTQPDDSRVFLRLWAAAVGDDEPALAAAFIRRDAAFRQVFATALVEGVADGSIPADIDVDATAASLVGLLRGIAMQWQVASDLLSLDDVRRTVRQLLDAGLQP